MNKIPLMIPFMGETVCRAFNFVFIPVFLLLLIQALTLLLSTLEVLIFIQCYTVYKYILFYFHVYAFAVHPEKVSGPGEVSFREIFFTHHAQLSKFIVSNKGRLCLPMIYITVTELHIFCLFKY